MSLSPGARMLPKDSQIISSHMAANYLTQRKH